MTLREFYLFFALVGAVVFACLLHIDRTIERTFTPCPNCECDCVQIWEGTVENPGAINAEHLSVYAVGERRR